MRTLVEIMLEMQPKLLGPHHHLAEQQAILKRLRPQVPELVLAHFLRLVVQGRKGAAAVRNGVCSSCHIRVASGVAAALLNPTDLHLCENCGAYLVIAPEELIRLTARRAPVVQKLKRKVHQPVTVAA